MSSPSRTGLRNQMAAPRWTRLLYTCPTVSDAMIQGTSHLMINNVTNFISTTSSKYGTKKSLMALPTHNNDLYSSLNAYHDNLDDKKSTTLLA